MIDVHVQIASPAADTEPEQHLDAEVLVSYLRRAGLSVSLADTCIDGQPEQDALATALATALARRPRLLYWHLPHGRHIEALTELSRSMGGSLREPLSETAREAASPAEPPPVMVAGGHAATWLDRELLQRIPGLDVVVRGELELPVTELALAARDGHPRPLRVPGTTARTRDGQGIQRIDPPARLIDLAGMPPAADDLLHPRRHRAGQKVLISRGCRASCQYCALPSYTRQGLDAEAFASANGCAEAELWRMRDAGSIVDEIELFSRRHGIKRFVFNGFVVLGHDLEASRGIEAVATELVQRDLGICFWIVTHPGPLARCRHLIPLLVAAGLRHVSLGIDTGSEAIRERYQLHHTRADTLASLEVLHEHGIDLTLSFIFYEPYMSLDDVAANIDLLRQAAPLAAHASRPYAQTVRRLLCTALRLETTTPIAERLQRDGLLVRTGDLGTEARASFRDAAVARFYRLHRAVVLELLHELDPTVTSHELPLDLLDELCRALTTRDHLDDDTIAAELRRWAHQQIAGRHHDPTATGT